MDSDAIDPPGDAPSTSAPAGVLVVGLGGLGSAAAVALASAHAGRLVLTDDGDVELEELDRSALFSQQDLGAHRASAARHALARRFPDLQIDVRPMPSSQLEARALLGEVGVVILAARAVPDLMRVHDAAIEARRPLVHATTLQFTVQLLTVLPFETPCLRCIFGDAPPDPAPAVDAAGGLAPLSGFGGALACGEAMRLLGGQHATYAGRMLIYEARSSAERLVKITRRPGCCLCGERPARSEA